MSNTLIFGLYPTSHPYFIRLTRKVIENILEESGIINMPRIIEDFHGLVPMFVKNDVPNTIFFNSGYLTVHGAVLHEYGHVLFNNSIQRQLNRSSLNSKNPWDTFVVNAEYHADKFAIETMQKMNKSEWLSAYLTMMLYHDDYVKRRYSHYDASKKSRPFETINPHWISAKRHFKQKRPLFYKFVSQEVVAHKIPYSYIHKVAV